MAVGFFATKAGVAAAYPQTPLVDWGVFYGGSGNQLGIQILGAAAIGVTTLALNGMGFGVLRALGCLRVPTKVRCSVLTAQAGAEPFPKLWEDCSMPL